MRTIRARLTLFTVLVVAGILGVMGLFVRARVQVNLLDEIDTQLREDVGTVKTGKSSPEAYLGSPSPANLRVLVRHDVAVKPPDAGRGESVMEVLRSQNGDVSLESKWIAPRLIPAGPSRLGGLPADDPIGLSLASGGEAIHDFLLAGQPMRSLTRPVLRSGKVVAYVQAVRPLIPARRQMADLDRALEMSIPVAILFAALGGGLLLSTVMRPLKKMTQTAERLDRDLSSARLPAKGTDEFAELATAINSAFDRTAAAFANQTRAIAQLERFTGDAGHELRTPLATIKTNASYLLHLAGVPAEHLSTLALIDVSADRMNTLIGDLLLLARQDSGQAAIRRCPVNILEAGYSALDRLGAEAETNIDPTLVARVDSDALQRVLINLLSNAIRHARKRVTLSARMHGNELIVEVADDGPGIAPEDVARLGERFFRPDQARARQDGGVGLGLAIVKSLAEGHGGDLKIASQVGKGTVATARFAT